MDIRTTALVLRRTNYGEADRILTLLTPEGKLSAIAKGVRRERSKLAGGIELFSLSKVTIHSGKGQLGILTSTRLENFYSKILAEYAALEFAYEVLKAVNRAAEQIDNPEFFDLTRQTLAALDAVGFCPLIAAWWWLNLARASGDQPNFRADTSGQKLSPDEKYAWDAAESALRPYSSGPISKNHIKLLRLLLSSPLALALRVQNHDPLLDQITPLAKSFSP